jgi:2-isopropylmalate synthase
VSQKSIQTLDTTLRDGTQTINVSFTLKDKLRIAQALDGLGVDYIEGGWPGSNPKDEQFFKEIKKVKLAHSKVAAFGSTRRKDTTPGSDPNLNAIIKSDTEVAVIFGKSWTLHVEKVLKIKNEENLELIYDSVSFLKASGLEVIFDAEHFFQGYDADREYALKALETAEEAKADVIASQTRTAGPSPVKSLR